MERLKTKKTVKIYSKINYVRQSALNHSYTVLTATKINNNNNNNHLNFTNFKQVSYL